MQTELEITPNTVLPIIKDELASRAEYRAMTTRGRETYEFPFVNIKVREGHNGRTKDNPGFSKESLEELARSIFNEGLQEPLTVDALKNGDALITKGERRWRAIGIIRGWIAEGKLAELFSGDPAKDIPTFDKVECFINPARVTEKDRNMMMLLENMARVDLTPLEQAEVIARLKEGGMTAAQIAKSVPGLSTMQVSNRLALASISEEEKELIREGKISPTAAVKLLKEEEDAAKRVEMINEAADGENGKLKIADIIDEETGEVLNPEDADNSLRDGDLTGASTSQPIDPNDDPSLKGTSPKAPPIPNRDPAQKAKEDIEQTDAKVISGKATAYDLVDKAIGLNKAIDTETDGKQSPKLTTYIYEMDRVLNDLRIILKR
jgi:ParB-like chromosome segregation protein Spo0J